MSAKAKPQIVPTLVSHGVLAWSAVLVLLFVAVLLLYGSLTAERDLRARLAEPVSTRVTCPAAAVSAPVGWEAFSRTDDAIELRRSRTAPLPFIRLTSSRSAMNAYHALDANAALLARRVARALASLAPSNAPAPFVTMNGSEIVTVKPGVSAVHFAFSDDTRYGEGLHFYLADRSYFVWGIADLGDGEASRAIRAFMTRPQTHLYLPDLAEDIERPVVDSAHQTPEGNRLALDEVDREIALWRLFADRAKTESSTALLPAIVHFREAVRRLSSIRQEDGILSGEDYATYLRLKAQREAIVGEWIVRLEKCRSMRDTEGAKRQARYIAEHATLMGEGPHARYARETLDAIEAEEQRAAAREGGAQ